MAVLATDHLEDWIHCRMQFTRKQVERFVRLIVFGILGYIIAITPIAAAQSLEPVSSVVLTTVGVNSPRVSNDHWVIQSLPTANAGGDVFARIGYLESPQKFSDDQDPPPPYFGLQKIFDEFAAGMNPLAQIELRTLENYYDPFGWQGSYGVDGYQPWRLGWVSYNDTTVLPASRVSAGTTGKMSDVEWNSNIRISELLGEGILFTGTGFFNAHWWDGPAGIGLPAQVDQISTDLELGFFNNGPWTVQLGVHPQLVEQYEAPLDKYAYSLDGRAVATFRQSAQISYVAGVALWDRVGVLVVPHVGVVLTPAPRWELRLLYPKARIGYYVGRWSTTDVWVYSSLEYTAEAWQSNVSDSATKEDRIQFTDERAALGIRWDTTRYSFFAETGYAFDRKAKFAGPDPDFRLDDVVLLRLGARY